MNEDDAEDSGHHGRYKDFAVLTNSTGHRNMDVSMRSDQVKLITEAAVDISLSEFALSKDEPFTSFTGAGLRTCDI